MPVLFKDKPIELKLRRVVMLTCGVVLVLTCTAYFTYELISFRQAAKAEVSMIAQIIAANSTAALAFDNTDDAKEILLALKSQKNIVIACLYDKKGTIFSVYPDSVSRNKFPAAPMSDGYRFSGVALQGFQPVIQGDDKLGTLYIKSDMSATYKRLALYLIIALFFAALSFITAYWLSRRLQSTIAQPIIDLAQAAKFISDKHDYRVRATKHGNDELGALTDAFNQMLNQIQAQNEEIVKFNQHLERGISERTKELEIANSELEKSNNDLEQFASVASHDLQEPLRKIRTFTGMAEKSLNNEAAAKVYLGKIEASALRMSNLISSVLNYSRLSHTDHQFEMVDLNDILANVEADLELVIEERKATVNSDVLPKVFGIALQFNQLFLNLLSNSLKFCEVDPIINISFREWAPAGDEMISGTPRSVVYGELVFSDNGIGFEQDKADKVFNIFQRLHSTRKYSGTGIGLALCKKVVERHGGTISVTSQPNAGTSFYIRLPVHIS